MLTDKIVTSLKIPSTVLSTVSSTYIFTEMRDSLELLQMKSYIYIYLYLLYNLYLYIYIFIYLDVAPQNIFFCLNVNLFWHKIWRKLFPKRNWNTWPITNETMSFKATVHPADRSLQNNHIEILKCSTTTWNITVIHKNVFQSPISITCPLSVIWWAEVMLN